MLVGWAAESPRDRIMTGAVCGVALLLAGAVAFPERSDVPFRMVAGIVGLAYVGYFALEVKDLVGGQTQALRVGTPSAIMAGFGLVIIGLPLLLFAFSGQGIVRHLKRLQSERRDGAGSGQSGPAA